MRSILSWAFTGVGLILSLAGVAMIFSAVRRLLEAAGSKNWAERARQGRLLRGSASSPGDQFEDEPERLVLEHQGRGPLRVHPQGVLLSGIDLGEAPEQSSAEKWAHERADRYREGRRGPGLLFAQDSDPLVLEPGLAKAQLRSRSSIASALSVTGIAMVLISRLWLAQIRIRPRS